MKKSLFVCAMAVLLFASCAEANGSPIGNGAEPVKAKANPHVVNGVVKAGNITEIEAAEGIEVNYRVGTPVSVKYTAPKDVAQNLDIRCVNGTLKCGYRHGTRNADKVVVDVVAPAVREFEATSAATINVTGNIKLNEVDIEASSAGSVNVPLVTANKVDIDASSSGTVNVGVAATRVEVDASGAATVNISGKCSYLVAEAEGAGTINATKALVGSGVLEAESAGVINVSKATKYGFKTQQKSGGTINIR